MIKKKKRKRRIEGKVTKVDKTEMEDDGKKSVGGAGCSKEKQRRVVRQLH